MRPQCFWNAGCYAFTRPTSLGLRMQTLLQVAAWVILITSFAIAIWCWLAAWRPWLDKRGDEPRSGWRKRSRRPRNRHMFHPWR
jgi:hypothetical protein